MKWTLILLVVTLTGAGGAWWFYKQAFTPTESVLPITTINEPESIEVLATDLSIPWEIVWLPDGTKLITERPGTLLQIAPDGTQRRIEVPRVAALGEGGLLGMALHPEYAENTLLYLYRTYQENGRLNEVVRYQYDQNTHTLHNEETILSNIPGARFHDGGRIAFGPDGYIYITTGDAGTPRLSQDRNSFAGKILRITATGAIPAGNPFGNEVYSYGHRNAQGIAWDSQGQLWSIDHSRSGVLSGMDELNRVNPGDNHGWPQIEGDQTAPGMSTPVAHSGPNETWAPAGLTAVGDTLFFSGLRGARLYRADIQEDGSIELSTYFANEYGRIRTVSVGPDEALYLLTSNTDGRGTPRAGDDRLIRVPKIEFGL